jgi:glutathione synthase/RimK-type ligase-like ATP-grasp enzyme
MNAIIVGVNGRPSIIQLLKMYKFDSPVTVFSQYHKKNGEELWKQIEMMSDGYIGIRPVKRPSFKNGDKVIFWGSRAQLNTGGAIVYNAPEKLAHASKKGLARKILKEKKLAIPKTEFSVDAAMRNLTFPMIVRPESHRAGKDFYVCNTRDELTRSFKKVKNGYISEFYPKQKEYRIHTASGKALLVKQKPEPDDKTEIAWNFAQNEKPWTTIDRKDYDIEMLKLAIEAIKVLELDFGAVDIMAFPTKRNLPKYVITEVNTAPSYTPYLIEKYGAYFNKLFSLGKKMDVFDTSKFKKGKSFSWKNFQLSTKEER